MLNIEVFGPKLKFKKKGKRISYSLNENLDHVKTEYPNQPECHNFIALLDEFLLHFPGYCLEKVTNKKGDVITILVEGF